MRFRILIFIFLASTFACADDDRSEKQQSLVHAGKQMTTIEWIESEKNYGRINEGQTLQVSFRFKNAGDHPLVIESVSSSCGCTVADYPKQPIRPGDEGEITASFSSDGRPYMQHKEITVWANTTGNQQHKLSFQVDVTPRKQVQ